MLFNSLGFLIFLPIVFLAFWVTPEKDRWILLLVASYYFYMCWNVVYIFLIFFTTFVSFCSALAIERLNNYKQKIAITVIGIVLCLLVLLFFKYADFIIQNINTITQLFSLQIEIKRFDYLLPVGISFFTFKTVGYIIDVYKGEIKAERHLGKYALFVSFFPQLVAGPIERSKNLLPEINKIHIFNYNEAVYGSKLLLWGFFKKIVVADKIAPHVDVIYNNVYQYQGFTFIIATLLFAFQIYCDFSGYSDIAIGTAKLFNIKVMTNFKSPYWSSSIKEFWGRWHISLSSWFRDYVYIPLGGNRCSLLRKNFNIFITFIISGLWHGTGWHFILWGSLHGIYQILENSFKKAFTKKWILNVLITFVFVNFAWILFRANSLSDALFIITNSFTGISNPLNYFFSVPDRGFFIKVLPLIIIIMVYDYLSIKYDLLNKINTIPRIIRKAIYAVVIILVIFFMNSGNEHQFIYSQF